MTYSFTNGTVADAGQVNTNNQDIVDATSDGTIDFNIAALTVAGNFTTTGTTNTIGNASSDDFVVTASLASTVNIKTTNTYDIGGVGKGLAGIYISVGATHAVRIVGSSAGSPAAWTLTIPSTAGVAGQVLVNGGSGTMEWAAGQYLYAAKSADYVVLTTDKISVINMTTGGTDRTITLPAAASSTDRRLTIKKVDGLDSDGTGKLTIARAGSDTIGGATSQLLFSAGDWLEIVSDGTNWQIISMCQVEYVYNSETTNANDTTSFAYGTGGAIMPNRTAGTSVAKDITWLSAMLATDRVFAETNDTIYWVAGAQQYPYSMQGSLEYGMNLVGISTTVIRVTFGSGGFRSGSGSYAANGSPWSSLSSASFKWRMVKVRII